MATAANLERWEIARTAHLRWFNVEDPAGPALEELAARFGLHELEIEDCRNPRERAKVEEHETHLFVIANTLHFKPEELEVWFGELDIFVGRDFLITVHKGPSRTVAAVKPKLEASRQLDHPDRILHALIDYIVDQYLPVLDNIGDRIEELEERAYERPTPETCSQIFAMKRALLEFRRTAATMREVLNALMRHGGVYLREESMVYFRDVYDHIVRAIDLVETYRDLLSGTLDIYLTSTAQRTNEVMKLLTVLATIALPLYIITGYFGMNFQHLPLLDDPHGVRMVHILMLAVTLGLLVYFRWKKWF